MYGEGQKGLRADHVGSGYKYDVYHEDEPYVKPEVEEGAPAVAS